MLAQLGLLPTKADGSAVTLPEAYPQVGGCHVVVHCGWLRIVIHDAGGFDRPWLL